MLARVIADAYVLSTSGGGLGALSFALGKFASSALYGKAAVIRFVIVSKRLARRRRTPGQFLPCRVAFLTGNFEIARKRPCLLAFRVERLISPACRNLGKPIGLQGCLFCRSELGAGLKGRSANYGKGTCIGGKLAPDRFKGLPDICQRRFRSIARSERGSLRSYCSSHLGPQSLEIALQDRQIEREPFGSLSRIFKSSALFSRYRVSLSRLHAIVVGGTPHRIDFLARREKLFLRFGALGAFTHNQLSSLIDHGDRGIPVSRRVHFLLQASIRGFEIGPGSREFLGQDGDAATLCSKPAIVPYRSATSSVACCTRFSASLFKLHASGGQITKQCVHPGPFRPQSLRRRRPCDARLRGRRRRLGTGCPR
ncbi:hypothetical protein LCM4579_11995 [Ensifer sp. LCM 4579]|nr:hypothetical protein LCM4579_11995 [Ensifer sp. LCM 4579]